MCALTACLDRTVSALVAQGDHRWRCFLGGYRRELSPYSDVDLMLLHDVGRCGCRSRPLPPLWDAKLTVGHSVRTVGRPRMLAERDSTPRQRFLPVVSSPVRRAVRIQMDAHPGDAGASPPPLSGGSRAGSSGGPLIG